MGVFTVTVLEESPLLFPSAQFSQPSLPPHPHPCLPWVCLVLSPRMAALILGYPAVTLRTNPVGGQRKCDGLVDVAVPVKTPHQALSEGTLRSQNCHRSRAFPVRVKGTWILESQT